MEPEMHEIEALVQGREISSPRNTVHVKMYTLPSVTNKTQLQIHANLSVSHTETLGIPFCEGN